jgi:predicted phage terminase large subunit-like protein
MNRKQAVEFLQKKPVKFAHMLGFTKMREFHNIWIRQMLKSKDDRTLEASRGTYKTTCVSIALALIIILLPNKRTMFMRKTDNDVKEVIRQVQNILQDPHTRYLVQIIYGVELRLTVQSATEISTNLTTDIKGTSQLVGMGIGASLTGKHFDYIFTDDIINIQDRISKAERDRTKLIYQELQNIKNRGGRIYNTLTPWHKDDASTLMPNIEKWDCYRKEIREILTAEELAEIKEKMLPSLFAANYELRHIASEDVIFTSPVIGGDPAMCEQGMAHTDAAFGGEDYTAFTVMHKYGGKYYVYGRLWRKHVAECYNDIKAAYDRFMCAKMPIEDNGDKGFTARDLKQLGIRAVTYHENMNKYLKITTYLKAIWNDIVFVDGTDEEYINQICDYNMDAEHDDAPDSCSSLARLLYNKSETRYKPLWN